MNLSQFYDSDLPIIQKWMADPQLMYYIVTEKSESSMPYVSFAIRSGPALIGWANLFNIDQDNKKAEYGIAIPNQRFTRLGGMATRQMLKYAFNDLGLHRVYVRPLASNCLPPGNDMRDRFGFVREGVERQAVKRGTIYEDVVVMSILKDEFKRRWE